MFTQLFHPILYENWSVDCQVYTVSVQCQKAICGVHCDHYVCDFMCVCKRHRLCGGKEIDVQNTVGFTFMLASNISNSAIYCHNITCWGLYICTYIPSNFTSLRDSNPPKIIPFYGSYSCP